MNIGVMKHTKYWRHETRIQIVAIKLQLDKPAGHIFNNYKHALILDLIIINSPFFNFKNIST